MSKERSKYSFEKFEEIKAQMAEFDLTGTALSLLERDIPERVNEIIEGRENLGWLEVHEDLLPQLAYERFVKFKYFLERLKKDTKNHSLYPKVEIYLNEGLKRIEDEIKYLKNNCSIDTEHRFFENPKDANPEPNYPVGRKPIAPRLKSKVKQYFFENEKRIRKETDNSDSKIAAKLIREIPELQKAINKKTIGDDTPRTWVRSWNGG